MLALSIADGVIIKWDQVDGLNFLTLQLREVGYSLPADCCGPSQLPHSSSSDLFYVAVATTFINYELINININLRPIK